MNITISKTARELGVAAACLAAECINSAIAKKGLARVVLATGASQFETLEELTKCDVDWSKVELFNLDEYTTLPETHIASFRKYLKERFSDIVNPKATHFVCGDSDEYIAELTAKIRQAPIDLGLIGIGQNSHLAFNDPPADFDTTAAYHIVTLDDRCKQQQAGEGWFATVGDVPNTAVSMTIYQIMQCEAIVSAVPHKEKAEAVQKTLSQKVSCNVPSTMLKKHPNIHLFLDENSAELFYTGA